MRDGNKVDSEEIFDVLKQVPLWFIVGEEYFYVWNCETHKLDFYSYQEMDVKGKHPESLGNLDVPAQPIEAIEILFPNDSKYTIDSNERQKLNHFYLSLLGQLAVNA